MEKPFYEERIVRMHQMLFDMARGNFNNHVPLSSVDDELETLVVLINMVAEELKESLFQVGSVATHSSHEFVTQTNFVLDTACHILSFTPEVVSFLGYGNAELIDQPLSLILSDASEDRLSELLQEGIASPVTVPLDFITKAQLLVSVTCSIGKLLNRSELLLSLVIPLQHDFDAPKVEESDYLQQSVIRKEDALLIQQLYDFIMAHLEEPLPSVQELSRQFGTNEFKLKAGFRHFFKTSIYQFYNEERLKRAYFMIEHTTIPLKNISKMNGFTNYPNFSKSFKKRFGFSPYALKVK